MKVPKGKSRLECEKLVMRFVSNLSWVEDRGFIVEALGGGDRPAPMARDKERGFFPESATNKALLALALMREGRALNHPAYAFLSFFRVLEAAFPTRRAREKWMNASVGSLRGHWVPEAVAELQARAIGDIGAHLYESGRCAIAHANRAPIVDPDDPADGRRLQSEVADHDGSCAEGDRGGTGCREQPDRLPEAPIRTGRLQTDPSAPTPSNA